jgi:phosphatidylserine decarboxylase
MFYFTFLYRLKCGMYQPQAIRTSLDVYGENVRKIVPIDSPQFGRVMAVCHRVGAMMVGSIKTTVEEGESVQRDQEFVLRSARVRLFRLHSVPIYLISPCNLRRWLNNCDSRREGYG